jgi:hypothetical protein
MKTTSHRLFLSCFFSALALAACGGRGLENPPPRDETPASCEDRGTVHASGTSWTCSDGCNTCSCDNGVTSSTLIGCGPPQPSSCNVFTADGGQTTYASGQSWTSGPCDDQCTCIDGTVACSGVACVVCVDEGVSHPIGSTWPCADGCGMCACGDDAGVSRNTRCDDGGWVPGPDAGPDASDASPPGECGSTEHLCGCSVGSFAGSFCLPVGYTCPAPTAPCPCQTAADCFGPLPALCEICADGGDGCAHFVCVGGACATAYCE